MIDELKAFVAVVDKTSVTAAADALSLTQSAVSRRIQQLESNLGVALFDRSSKPVTPTAVGRRIYQFAIQLLRDADRLISITAEEEEPSGTFRLGLTQVVADVALFEAVKQMKADFPRLDLRCLTEWSSGLQRELDAGRLDAATLMLVSGSEPPPSVQRRFIATIEVLVVQSKRRPLVAKIASVDELAEKEWILNPLGCGYRAALQRAVEGAGKQVRLGVDTQGTETQLRLVAAGFGLGLAPRSLLKQSAHMKDLAIVQVPDFSLSLDVWLIHAIEVGNLKRAMSALGDVLSQTFGLYQSVKRS
ncbi:MULTISPECIES: LysR family transcriptional regulator [Cupriavidus]|uniref:DNA-binding transcriptional LysR family regulator n=2 Tax=Cupriavidus TaxID=106589 RepID=A0A7W4VGR0_9BURK|nr:MULTISPECIES: LysR family transcriptional regulator [Cupriavidus]MBB3011301.1 DNA-binding transcriptional LysR family regulator [Cupriavidus alkaliphilus]QBY56306.1 LysR family transcriptional regulator [Cupriavidus oxalaticus]